MSDLSKSQWAEIDEEFDRKIAAKDAEIERLREALKFALKRIEFYGTISDRRHFDHDLVEVYPKINSVINQQSTNMENSE